MMMSHAESFDANAELADLLDEVRPVDDRGGETPEELAASDMLEEGSPIVSELEDEDDLDDEDDDEDLDDDDDVDDEDFDDDEDDLDDEDEDEEDDWDDEEEDDEDWDEDDDADGPMAFFDDSGSDDFEDADVTVDVEVDVVEVQCTDAAGGRVTLVEETVTERMIAAN